MTQPLTPPDCDLQDFPYMPLHVARLRDSNLAAEGNPEGCWYAVLLWSASWHQLPAGSLPATDAVLARLCGLGRDLRTLKKHRADALRGWVLCDDGRLYHPVVADEVLRAWRSKVEQRHRTECARVKKANQRNGTDDPAPTLAAFVSSTYPASVPYLSLGTPAPVPRDTDTNVPRETASKGEGEGEGYKKEEDDVGERARSDASAGKPEPIPPEPSPPDPYGDLPALAARAGRAAGVAVNPSRPKPFADQLDAARQWLEMGLDPDTEIIPALAQDVLDNPGNRHSLNYFTPLMARIAAQKDALANGLAAQRPNGFQRNGSPDAAGPGPTTRAAQQFLRDLKSLPGRSDAARTG